MALCVVVAIASNAVLSYQVPQLSPAPSPFSFPYSERGGERRADHRPGRAHGRDARLIHRPPLRDGHGCRPIRHGIPAPPLRYRRQYPDHVSGGGGGVCGVHHADTRVCQGSQSSGQGDGGAGVSGRTRDEGEWGGRWGGWGSGHGH